MPGIGPCAFLYVDETGEGRGARASLSRTLFLTLHFRFGNTVHPSGRAGIRGIKILPPRAP
jgi:hypothetical protein